MVTVHAEAKMVKGQLLKFDGVPVVPSLSSGSPPEQHNGPMGAEKLPAAILPVCGRYRTARCTQLQTL